MNIDFAKVCGKHTVVYEAYYKQIDPKGTGAIEAMTAAKFLKKSGLSDVVLSRIWDLSDPNGKGFLDKPGFFIALKLVSLSQAGQVANLNNIYVETINPPKVGEIPKTMPSRIQTVPVSSGGVANGDWTISVIDRLKYEQLFESLHPQNGMLPGNKVKGVLMDSKLPMNILGTIWDLADQDKDGNLDKHEFIVAMHLIYQTLQKRTVPSVLPPELRKAAGVGPRPKPAMPPAPGAAPMPRAPSGEGFGDDGFVANFPKDMGPPAAIPPLPIAVAPMTRIPPVGAVSAQPLIQTDPLIPIGAPPSVTANADWVVTPAELLRFEVIFRQSDLDKDGLVSGLEVKDIFMKSGIPQRTLADIWALCDTNQSGKLTVDQFALAMWLVERKQRGVDPPHVLTANMVPPSLRATVSGVDLQPQETKPTYSNPELEMISKEIEELARERRALETEIAQKEADVRIKNGEVRSLQTELDTLTATLKQLENQRGEAQKRLDDLQAQVGKIRDQCLKQEETINEQEGELNAKRSELQKLKDEETALQNEYDNNNRELSKLTKHLQNTQLQISSVRSMVTQLMETQRQMTDALLICRAAMENQNAELVSEYQLKIEPDFDDARKTLQREIEITKEDPFEENNSALANKQSNATNGFTNDPFAGPIKATASSGFDDSFNMSSGFESGFDTFGHDSGFGHANRDPFGADAFSANNKANAKTPEPDVDAFGSDPFAALHAPTGQGQVLSPNTQKSGPPPRPESPSPALPPKKSKMPPPRPAPPRPAQQSNAFGSSAAGGSFADFDDFDNKLQQTIPTPNTSTNTNTNTNTSTHITMASTALLDSFSLFDDAAAQSKTQRSPCASPAQLATAAQAPLHTLLLASSLPTGAVSSTSSNTTTVAAATATSTSNTNTNNQHLSRSNTPLQTPQGLSVFDAFGKTKSQTPTFISGPTDFKDDPFKDYRYEDPFNIKDPFADDDIEAVAAPALGTTTKNFKADFSSDDEGATTPNNNNNNNMSRDCKDKPKMLTPTGHEMLHQFDAFNLHASPVPSQKSTTSNSQPAQVPLDAFADFDDIIVDKRTATPTTITTTTLATSKSNNQTDAFFDAFDDTFNANPNSAPKAKTNESAVASTKLTTDSFDAFAAINSTNNNNNKNKSITGQDKLFNAFNDNNFEDCFNNKPAAASTSLDNDFAQFDTFDVHNFSNDFTKVFNSSNQSTTTMSESATKKELNVKMKDKFAADYSKPESFDADLEEALKRSMLDN